MCVSVFAGCSLVERDNERYLNAVVATIDYKDGNKDQITKRELLTAYNSYGYYYVQNGSTKQEAVETTLETVVEKHLTVKAVKDYYKENGQEELNGKETTYLWDQTYNSMLDNLTTYFKEIVDVPAEEEQAEQSANKSVFKNYDRAVEFDYEDVLDADQNVVGQKLVIVKKSLDQSNDPRVSYTERQNDNGWTVDFELEKDGSYPFKDALYNKLMSVKSGNDDSARNWSSAINNYVSDIKENYDYKNFKTAKDAMMFEIERVYDILKDNYYSQKYTNIFNTQTSAIKSNVTVDQILKAYSKKVREDYTKYEIEGGNFSTDVLSSRSSVDYIKEGENYFYLSYIKFDIDAAQLESLKIQKENGTLVGAKYEEAVNAVYANAYATVRNATTGEIELEGGRNKTVLASSLTAKIKGELEKEYLTVETMTAGDKETADELGLTYEQYVNEINSGIAEEKADAFRPYLYLYNADDSLKGADYNAVFGVDKSGNIVASETFSKNEEALAQIKALYDGGNAKIGDTTGLVKADNAMYLFFYAGEVENVFEGVDENFDISRSPEAIKTLATTKLNIFSDKTIFDVLYSEATKDYFSVFETMNMSYLRSLTEKIEFIENELKDLY